MATFDHHRRIIKFKVDKQTLAFKLGVNPVKTKMSRHKMLMKLTQKSISGTISPCFIQFNVGYACTNVNVNVSPPLPGDEGKALVVNEGTKPEWGAEINHNNQVISGGQY